MSSITELLLLDRHHDFRSGKSLLLLPPLAPQSDRYCFSIPFTPLISWVMSSYQQSFPSLLELGWEVCLTSGDKGQENLDMGWTDLRVDLLQGLEEGLEGGAAKVGDGVQAREQTPVQHLLEVPLTDVLGAQRQVRPRTVRVSA